MNDQQLTKTRLGSIFLQGLLFGILGLSVFYYFLLFVITKDPSHPLSQFKLFQPWMSLLIIGFGIQMGLFWLMKKGVKFNLQEKKDANLAVGTGTVVSGVAMIACCAHHAVEVLPLVGLSAAALFLGEYQEQFLILGVLSNLFGITMMLWFITGKAKPHIIARFVKSQIRRSL